jgi:hypothetical protein
MGKMTTDRAGKKQAGKWAQGQSGNPSGRPKGTGEVAKLRNGIAEHLPEIIVQLVVKAKEGDAQAARLLLERVLPALKPIEQPVKLTLPAGEGITGQGRAIVQAVAAGILAPSQGAALLAGLGALAHIVEIDELEKRITLLEGMKNGKH